MAEVFVYMVRVGQCPKCGATSWERAAYCVACSEYVGAMWLVRQTLCFDIDLNDEAVLVDPRVPFGWTKK